LRIAPQKLLFAISPMGQSIPSHHLPRPAQNAADLAVLAAAPLINLAISINCFNHFRTISKH
jgi:hypothetical protein